MADVYDVAVAGAGPSGAVSAMLFARHGFRVALLDQAHFPRDKACAEYLSPGIWSVARRIGIEDTILGCRPRSLLGMEIVSVGGASLPIEYARNAWAPPAITVPRRTLDAALVEEAARNGAEVVLGHRVLHPIRDDPVVIGVETSHGGKARSVRSRLLVIADGARSSLARTLGVVRPARWPVRLGLVAHLRGNPPLNPGFGRMYVAGDGYCGVAPLPPDPKTGASRVNVAMVVALNRVREAGLPASVFFDRWIAEQPHLRDLLAGCAREEPVRGVGPIGARCAQPYLPGALLVGDAAGFFDPFTGEGVYRALVSAELAASVGARALTEGNVSASALRPYARLRTRAFRRKEAVTALVQLFVRFPALLDYAAPRLRGRTDALDALSLVLGDLKDARTFLRPGMLWEALRP